MWDLTILTQIKKDGGFGFRKMESFNLALLAKLSWKIITEPKSLCEKILKGIYFPHCSFENVVQGSRPSWIWNNILQGRSLLLDGIRWNVHSSS